MPTESVRRRERQETTERRNSGKTKASFWISVLTSLATAAVVGVLSRRLGHGAQLGVAFATVILAIFCAGYARQVERERTRRSQSWMVLAGLAVGFAGASGLALGEPFWKATLVVLGASVLVAVVLGKPPERERGRARDLS